ncbi:Cytosolic carboxypeptidase 1 [Trichinella sp. T6]|nr:Cytosolic carboxypeptidase 1 [Trichinella sp. T6]
MGSRVGIDLFHSVRVDFHSYTNRSPVNDIIMANAVELCRKLCQQHTIGVNKDAEEWSHLAKQLHTKCSVDANDKSVQELWDNFENIDETLLLNFLLCFEHCRNSEAIVWFTKILQQFISRPSADPKSRLQLMAKLNGVSFLCKCLRWFVRKFDETDEMIEVIQALIPIIQIVGGVDGRFFMKVRFLGLLDMCINVMCNTAQYPLTESLLDFLAFACRSGQNASALVKNEMMVPFLKKIFAGCEKTTPSVIRKYAELLFLMAKPKKTRKSLVSQGIIPSVLELFRAFFGKDDNISQINCNAALGTLRLLTSTISGRQNLVACNGLEIFRDLIRSFDESEASSPLCSHMYHSISSLCIRCLPMRPLPIDNMKYPVDVSIVEIQHSTPDPPEAVSDSEDDISVAAGFLTDTDDEAMSRASQSEKPPIPLRIFQKETHWYRFLTRELDYGTLLSKDGTFGNVSAKQTDNMLFEMADLENFMLEINQRQRRRSISSLREIRLSGKHRSITEQLLEKSQSGMPTWYHWIDYCCQAVSTRSVIPFESLGYPDMHGCYPNLPQQKLKCYPNALLNMVGHLLERLESNKDYIPKVVYDLDQLVATRRTYNTSKFILNNDIVKLGRSNPNTTSLQFESRFEGGNLRKVGPYEYDLILTPDTNQMNEYYHTYYFQVSNMLTEISYTLNIINCVKTRSLYNSGMQPLVFSVTEALLGRPGWVRIGGNCVYYRNFYSRGSSSTASKSSETVTSYYTASFNVHFRHRYDICYFAYHYPYTYTMLKTHLVKTNQLLSLKKDIHFRTDVMCHTLSGNPVILVTVTELGDRIQLKSRDIVVLSARIHPGESNSSWMMHGMINYLISDHPFAKLARSKFIFKLIPMLNVDGVINGNHRCSLAGKDLNRQWVAPERSMYPSIYHTKNLISYLHRIGRTPFVYCDFHGHSRKMNVFLYGNNPNLSWYTGDRLQKHGFEFYQFPEILDETSTAFELKYCAFTIKKNKEGSARVAIWRDTGISRAYTLEASYAGFDTGGYKGHQITTRDLIEMGEQFVESLVRLKKSIEQGKSPTRRFEIGAEQKE